MTDPDLIRALSPIIRAFEQSGIPYYIGGSLASSVYGLARATIDVDLVAGIETYHVDSLKSRPQDEYYIDEMMIVEAIEHGSSFNLIHLELQFAYEIRGQECSATDQF